jgi:glucose-6-phosphate 1-dehydrogenase
MPQEKKLPPVLLFIFGGSGDLNYRKLTPALFNLFLDKLLPEKFTIIGIARTEYNGDAYKQHLKEGIDNFSRKKDDAKWKDFATHIDYLQMDIGDEKAYTKIEEITKQKEAEFGQHPVVIFYMAVAPVLAEGIINNIGALHICKDIKCTRIVALGMILTVRGK